MASLRELCWLSLLCRRAGLVLVCHNGNMQILQVTRSPHASIPECFRCPGGAELQIPEGQPLMLPAMTCLVKGFAKSDCKSPSTEASFMSLLTKLEQLKQLEVVMTAGNYLPSWTESLLTYQVLGKWPKTLWKQYKVTDAVYESYLVLCRDGVPARLRNLRICQNLASKRAAETAWVDCVKRIRSNLEIYHPFPPVPAACAWLETFKKDALRYPVLIVLGPSRAGKTEWAKSLFQCPLELKIGCLTFFPDGMRRFQRGVHDGLVLDDVRDLQFVVDHQEKLQGKYDHLVEFGLTTHNWLSKSRNRVIVQLPGEQCPTPNSS